MPESLLSAAKKVAELSSLGWADVNRVYRELQDGDRAPALPPSAPATGLPKSTGRNVWFAHPNFVARLLIGLAGRAAGLNPRKTVQQFHDAKADDQELYLEEVLAALLRNPTLADDLLVFELNPDGPCVEINHPKFRGKYIPINTVDRADLMFRPHTFSVSVRVNPRLIMDLAATVQWLPEGYPPFRGATAEDVE